MAIDGVYTAYLTGVAGQSLAMFVFFKGRVTGADMSGVVFDGSYRVTDEHVEGEISYRMPAESISITGATFEDQSEILDVTFQLPTKIDHNETYRILTPIGPVNAKFVKNTGL